MSSEITSAYQQLKEIAQSRWNDLVLGDKPVILVGTATCGRAAGAIDVLESIRNALGDDHQDIPVLEVGCMGHCYAEPLVAISKPVMNILHFCMVTLHRKSHSF